jgi:hypothetical protein
MCPRKGDASEEDSGDHIMEKMVPEDRMPAPNA